MTKYNLKEVAILRGRRGGSTFFKDEKTGLLFEQDFGGLLGYAGNCEWLVSVVASIPEEADAIKDGEVHKVVTEWPLGKSFVLEYEL